MHPAVEALHNAINAVAAIDPALLDHTELHEVAVALQRERQRLGVAAAGSLEAWNTRKVWADNGSLSPAARLARDTHVSTATAKSELRRARRVRRLPVVAERILAGRCSLDHVDVFARTLHGARAQRIAGDETMLVDAVSGLDLGAATKVVKYWCQQVDAANGTDPEPVTESGAQISTTLDDAVVLDAVFGAIDGAIITAELDRLIDELKATDRANGVERTPAERRAAAFVEMARRSATAPADGRPPRPLFSVLLGDDSFRRLCELAGAVLTPEQLLPWLDEATFETILFDGPTTVISVSHRRTFTGALRRAIQVRDRHCQHPAGCTTPAERCDVDHIVPASQGGPTSQFNGRIECGPHNRIHHLHDHHAQPRPERTITRLDELRARVRWRNQHLFPEDLEDPPNQAHAS